MTSPERGGFEPSAYREIFEGINEAIFVHDLAGRILLVNARTCAMYECSRQEALRLSIADISLDEPPYSQREAVAYIDRAIAQGECSFEWRSRRRSGALFWTEVALRAFDLDGRPHVMASVRDIDARKRIEASLRESEERFAKIFNATSTMLAFTERGQGRIIDVNQAWLAATGARRQDVIGKTGSELGLWADAADRARILDELDKAGRVHEVEADLVMGGRTLPARISVEYIEMHGERYLLWELDDLSERKHAERDQEQLRTQLLQAQKMESIGQLAGGIAHDFNNILSTILGFGDLVMAKLPVESKESKYVAEIVRAGERASELTKQILAFSRKQVMQPRVVDPVGILRGMEPMLRRLIGENIALDLPLAPATSPIRVDVSHLEQAIMNLVVNARDAMPDGGTLTLETADVDFDGSYVSSHVDALPGPHVMIAVSDTGAGMDAATRARAFEPFFTTKGPARGTGLGLSTVYGIVKQSGGWVWLYSEPGRGTTFKLYFPRSPRSGEALEPVSDAAWSHVRPKADTIVLMVEDDPQVRLLVATILGGAGYTVLVAGDPREALEMSKRYAGEIDLLLTDVVMPHMSGRQLADKITAARPGTRVMYVSGYTENTIVHHGEVDEGVNFLSKPITSNRLLGMVARVLAGAAEPQPQSDDGSAP
jgi:two-component system, cell cycle sensor histidine kinase and response regulator CckA